MKPWTKQLAPWLIALSLFGNVYLGVAIYNREVFLNHYSWGNAANQVLGSVNLLRDVMVPGPEGNIDGALGKYDPAGRAAQSLEALGQLPDYQRRVDPADMRDIQQFIRYAGSAYSLALQEQQAADKISAESDKRLRKAAEGLNLMLQELQAMQKLVDSPNPWNYAGWRAVWHRIAIGLKAMDFVPLPE